MNHTKNYECESYIFIAFEINILFRNVCILKCEYALYTALLIQYIHAL